MVDNPACPNEGHFLSHIPPTPAKHTLASVRERNLAKENEEPQQANINDGNMQGYDDQQPLEIDIVQPEGLSNASTEKYLENVGVQGGTQRGSHSDAQRTSNPEFRVGSNFRVIPERYFSGVENVSEFLENIDNNLTYYEIPTQLACAYLKGHLTGRALDWFDVLGHRVVEDKATDYAYLKQA
ncbi:uncharacterized protein TNCV_2805141 [Trichonephila clavipes]|nr:uncharacterized protein TNCV_2805141 [Trichonephila clavipes]